ncbi:type IV toxin-antitoxin system AbiEi family antitoxin [Pseudomonas sp. NY15437]|uniref:type IV toxin-antitoxin system AbiEi family antitoxin n=1 Tax=Pseudomonas sp. NY15437 TaxID=3400360 RepID=UPI003A85EE85
MIELLTAALNDALEGVAEVEPVNGLSPSKGAPDALLTLKSMEGSVQVAVEVVRNAYPRDIQRAVWVLDEATKTTHDQDHIRLVAAETLSPGAKQSLKERGIAYFEKSGSLYLRSKGWLINIAHPSKGPSRPETISLFTDAREGVVHALLMHAHQWLTGAELAEMAHTSPYTCSVVLKELERREWCDSMGGGRTLRRRLVEPGKLLDAWAEDWRLRAEVKTRGYLFVENRKNLLREVSELIHEKDISGECILSGAAAANAYAPLLTEADMVDLVVHPGMTKALIETLKLKPTTKGANVQIVERDHSAFLFTQTFNDQCSLASPFVLYLDLLDGRGRNKELAQYIREKMESTWAI